MLFQHVFLLHEKSRFHFESRSHAGESHDQQQQHFQPGLRQCFEFSQCTSRQIVRAHQHHAENQPRLG